MCWKGSGLRGRDLLHPIRREWGLRSLQAFGFGQLGLSFVESPKLLRLHLKSADHVQAVQRAHPKLRPVAASEVRAEIEGVFGERRFKPPSSRPVSFKVTVYLL